MSGQVKYTVDDYRKVVNLYKSCNALYNAVWLWNEVCGVDAAFHPETATVAEELAEVAGKLVKLMAYSLTGENRLMPPHIFLEILSSQ